ncbi:hypoxanthine phosphoribosyltransferase [Corynebacterium appendicis CIP 107643]|uniref:Hypoxanthine phosphoribosyltransferase n=1 Tax=Corynebacterium appendicis CIP 107643 TaxID=1161099 RepID=A0A1N7J6T8_9CORY|nr:hypoxanthine phosphoribosyltransferase [Corynebacterium appendicis]WJY61866.1 Hypoxanthine phosphoribosyltransferase [Corynebacterium appendicis CIP 107643]SIS45078.1 hypoxanthine phosphoribosyltransferase [Corynebacterium appendicis CIP 107643]
MAEGTRLRDSKDFDVPANRYGDDVEAILIPEDELNDRIQEMADKVSELYRGAEDDLILVCVLKGAVYFLTDFARALSIPSEVEFMAVSSYGNSTTSSGVVRIMKDLDKEISGRDVLVVEDIIDSGLTLSWLLKNLSGRQPKSLNVITLLRKPEVQTAKIGLFDVGFDIPNEFVIGYGLDYAERYRDLPYVGTLHPRVYSDVGEEPVPSREEGPEAVEI